MRTASPPTGRKMADGPPRALLLRPVRPGEKRSTPPLAGLSPASARFEFFKKFAAILTQRPPADGEGEPSSQDRPSQAGEEASGRGELPFKPPQAPKLNLNRPDLLTRPMVPECEPLGEQEGSVLINQSAVLPPAPLATSSLLDWSALDSDPLLEPDEELQEGSGDQTADMSIISSKIARAQSPRQDRRAAPTTAVTTVFIKRSEVEEVVEGCRAMVLSVETGLAELEHDLPLCISLLDEKIAVLHNLKLDFMLELASDAAVAADKSATLPPCRA